MLSQERAAQIISFRQYARARGIKGAAIDLDDFFARTNADVFMRQMRRFSGHIVSAEPDIPLDYMHGLVLHANKLIHAEMGVDPRRWHRVVDMLGSLLGKNLRPTLERFTPTLLHVYDMVPRVVPGAFNTLSVLHEVMPVAVNTHAPVWWTDTKLTGMGLLKFVSHVHVVPVTQKHKEDRDWDAAARGLDLRPGEVMTGGDSLVADAIPAITAGVRPERVCLIQSPWGKHNSNGHEVPHGIRTPARIGDWIPSLLREQ